MRITNVTKYLIGSATLVCVAACSLSTEMDATIEREVEAAVQMKEAAKVPGKVADDGVVKVKNDIWLGDTSEVEYEGEPIPDYLETKDGITLISNRPITLFEIGDMINKITSIRVSYASQMEDEVLKNAVANKPTAASLNADWTEPNKMIVSYQGSLSGLLDEICARFGLWWKYEKKEIYFYKYITKTFVLYSLPTKPSMSFNLGGQTTGASGGGSSSLSLSNTASIELWENIEKSIKSMISKGSELTMDPSNGIISLTATPTDIKKVAKFVNEQNARLSKQVTISVKVLQVSIDDSDNYGLNLTTVFGKTGDDFTSTITSAPNLSDVSSGISMGILSGKWDVTAAIKAISEQGTTNLITSGSVTTMNNKPAPIQVVRKQNYVSEITKTNSGGDSNYYDISTETEEIETGFTMDVLPRVLEHGRLMMMFNLTLSDLIQLEKVDLGGAGESGGQYIQNPVIETRGFSQEVALRSGESLILSGYERVENTANKTGVGSADNSLLGGNATAGKKRNILVIILTPVVLESPLNPESRMGN